MRFAAARTWLLLVLPVLIACGSSGLLPERGLAEAAPAAEAGAAKAAAGDDDAFFDLVPEPDGFRMETYRAPVPKSLKDAKVLSDKEAMTLWRSKSASFIDVLPRAPKPANLPKGTIWREKKRLNIPGSTWLVNVGYGVISAATESYFKSNLEQLTAGKKNAPVVFYCLASCWMSWNAAKRAVSWGYSSVHWYPDGTDGWVKVDGKLEVSEPVK